MSETTEKLPLLQGMYLDLLMIGIRDLDNLIQRIKENKMYPHHRLDGINMQYELANHLTSTLSLLEQYRVTACHKV